MNTNKAFLVSLAVAALALSGCGGGRATNSSPASARRVVLEWDATGATSRIASYRTELKNEVVHVAAEHGDLFAVVLDGQPLTTSSVTARNFAEAPPDGIEPNHANEALAAGFAHDFITSFTPQETVAGSGQLQGLMLAAQTPHVGEVVLWSDGVVNEPADGFDLSAASVPELNAEIARWKPKLAGLRGVTVVIVGVGRGVHRIATVERAHRLFSALVEGNGGRLVWTPTLAQR